MHYLGGDPKRIRDIGEIMKKDAAFAKLLNELKKRGK
jgi:hypothetical protein